MTIYSNGDGGQNKMDRILVDQHSTLQRHMASQHEVCNYNSFINIIDVSDN